MLPLIGISSCLMYENTQRQFFNGRPILFLEESMGHFVQRHNALPLMIPTEPQHDYKKIAERMDGLILQGGVDVSPLNYKEKPLKDAWKGDAKRDAYELKLIEACLTAQKPILGICRGSQILNVFFGGSLYQDINTLIPQTLIHRDQDLYENNKHTVCFEQGGLLDKLYPGRGQVTINSVHHQAVKDLGRGLRIEARSDTDGVIEAISTISGSFCLGLQWHPEFQNPLDKTLLDPTNIMQLFLKEAKNYVHTR